MIRFDKASAALAAFGTSSGRADVGVSALADGSDGDPPLLPLGVPEAR